uniref:Protein kinase domain-containing protein n=3 Tax=Aegilops tauschii subsp. strangulata TaxID=200361 RepID=A0A453PRT8_AEGTS
MNIGLFGTRILRWKAHIQVRHIQFGCYNHRDINMPYEIYQRLLCFEYIPKGYLYDYITGHIQVRHIQFGCYNHRDTNMTYGIYQRLLCFEYVYKGSLHDYITDASRGLEWGKRYLIIKGICEGLYYLKQESIINLDLKPANISVDNNMLPKIADFGLPRCYDENQNWINVIRLSLSKLINGGFAVVYKVC